MPLENKPLCAPINVFVSPLYEKPPAAAPNTVLPTDIPENELKAAKPNNVLAKELLLKFIPALEPIIVDQIISEPLEPLVPLELLPALFPIKILSLPDTQFAPAFEPINVLFISFNILPVLNPINVLLLANVKWEPALLPNAVLNEPELILFPQFTPINVLSIPIEFNLPALSPIVIVPNTCSFWPRELSDWYEVL